MEVYEEMTPHLTSNCLSVCVCVFGGGRGGDYGDIVFFFLNRFIEIFGLFVWWVYGNILLVFW